MAKEAGDELPKLEQALRHALAGTRKANHKRFAQFIHRAASGLIRSGAMDQIKEYVSVAHEHSHSSWHRDEPLPGFDLRETGAEKAATRLAYFVGQMDDLEFDDWAGDLSPFGEDLDAVIPEHYSRGVEASRLWRSLLISFADSLEAARDERAGAPENTYAYWLSNVIATLAHDWERHFGDPPKSSSTSPFYSAVSAVFYAAGQNVPAPNTVRKALTLLAK